MRSHHCAHCLDPLSHIIDKHHAIRSPRLSPSLPQEIPTRIPGQRERRVQHPSILPRDIHARQTIQHHRVLPPAGRTGRQAAHPVGRAVEERDVVGVRGDAAGVKRDDGVDGGHGPRGNGRVCILAARGVSRRLGEERSELLGDGLGAPGTGAVGEARVVEDQDVGGGAEAEAEGRRDDFVLADLAEAVGVAWGWVSWGSGRTL